MKEKKKLKQWTRADLRGKPLDDDCKIAKISTHEYGPEDNRKYCYGLIEMSTEETLEKCKECGAFAFNAQPLPYPPNMGNPKVGGGVMNEDYKIGGIDLGKGPSKTGGCPMTDWVVKRYGLTDKQVEYFCSRGCSVDCWIEMKKYVERVGKRGAK